MTNEPNVHGISIEQMFVGRDEELKFSLTPMKVLIQAMALKLSQSMQKVALERQD